MIEILNYEEPKQEKDGWIPVKEHLPKDNESVLISFINTFGKYRTSEDGKYFLDKHGNISLICPCSGWYRKKGQPLDGFYTDNGFYFGTSGLKVTAWMPLPEPYKED